MLQKRNVVVFLALCVLFFGYKCHESLLLEAYPDVANMQVRVITLVPGKAPEEVERLVTIPLEKSSMVFRMLIPRAQFQSLDCQL